MPLWTGWLFLWLVNIIEQSLKICWLCVKLLIRMAFFSPNSPLKVSIKDTMETIWEKLSLCDFCNCTFPLWILFISNIDSNYTFLVSTEELDCQLYKHSTGWYSILLILYLNWHVLRLVPTVLDIGQIVKIIFMIDSCCLSKDRFTRIFQVNASAIFIVEASSI